MTSHTQPVLRAVFSKADMLAVFMAWFLPAPEPGPHLVQAAPRPPRHPGGAPAALVDGDSDILRVNAAGVLAKTGAGDFTELRTGQADRAASMAAQLIEARDAVRAARQAGQPALDAGVLEDLLTRYRALAANGSAADGSAANIYRREVARQRSGRDIRPPIIPARFFLVSRVSWVPCSWVGSCSASRRCCK